MPCMSSTAAHPRPAASRPRLLVVPWCTHSWHPRRTSLGVAVGGQPSSDTLAKPTPRLSLPLSLLLMEPTRRALAIRVMCATALPSLVGAGEVEAVAWRLPRASPGPARNPPQESRGAGAGGTEGPRWGRGTETLVARWACCCRLCAEGEVSGNPQPCWGREAISSTGGKYGLGMPLDVLKGCNTEKIRSNGFDALEACPPPNIWGLTLRRVGRYMARARRMGQVGGRPWPWGS